MRGMIRQWRDNRRVERMAASATQRMDDLPPAERERVIRDFRQMGGDGDPDAPASPGEIRAYMFLHPDATARMVAERRMERESGIAAAVRDVTLPPGIPRRRFLRAVLRMDAAISDWAIMGHCPNGWDGGAGMLAELPPGDIRELLDDMEAATDEQLREDAAAGFGRWEDKHWGAGE